LLVFLEGGVDNRRVPLLLLLLAILRIHLPKEERASYDVIEYHLNE